MSRLLGILAGMLAAGNSPLDRVARDVIAHDADETARERRKRKASVEKKKARKNVKASRKKNRSK